MYCTKEKKKKQIRFASTARGGDDDKNQIEIGIVVNFYFLKFNWLNIYN